MSACCCSLAGTNTCKNCSRNVHFTPPFFIPDYPYGLVYKPDQYTYNYEMFEVKPNDSQ